MKIYSKNLLAMLLVLALCAFAGCNNTEETEESEESSGITINTEITGLYPIINGETYIPESETSESYSPLVTPPPEQDTKSPMFLRVKENVTLIKGDEFDLNSYISYIDNYDRNPKLTQIGDVDTSVPGKYEVKAEVEDYAGNKRTATINVNVLAEKPPKSNNNSGNTEEERTIKFDEFIERYKDENVSFGIDVSRWNETIDFEKVKAAGCEFVMMRAGVYYDGDFHADTCFYENFKNAKAAGLKVGVYMYTVDNDETLLRQHVDSLCKDILKGEKLDFPIAFDWESWNHFQNYNMSMMDMNNLFYAFCDQLEKNGYEGMLYSSKSKLLEIWEPKDYPVWLAHYTKKTTYEGDYIMWQVDEVGRIDGIKGNVDINLYYGGKR